jgi:hypothetical protein
MAISLLDRIKTCWKSLFSFSFPGYSVPALKFPLTGYRKETIIENIKIFDYSILQSCWTCERPMIIKKKKLNNGDAGIYITSCGECDPCKKIKNTVNISFDSLQTYRTVFHKTDFLKELKKWVDNIVRNTDFSFIPARFVTMETVDHKTAEVLLKKRQGKGPRHA